MYEAILRTASEFRDGCSLYIFKYRTFEQDKREIDRMSGKEEEGRRREMFSQKINEKSSRKAPV